MDRLDPEVPMDKNGKPVGRPVWQFTSGFQNDHEFAAKKARELLQLLASKTCIIPQPNLKHQVRRRLQMMKTVVNECIAKRVAVEHKRHQAELKEALTFEYDDWLEKYC